MVSMSLDFGRGQLVFRPLLAFGRRLKGLRLERGLSQEQLAGLADLDRTYVSSCEAGRRNATIRTIAVRGRSEVDPAALVSELVLTHF